MLATILKSTRAVATTIAIIATFAKIKELTQAMYQFSKAKSDLLDNELIVSQHETSFKIKLPFFEITTIVASR